MGKIKKHNKPDQNFRKITKKLLFDLSGPERKGIRNLYQSPKFTFTINPFTLKKIQPNTAQYVMFIDARINECYLNIKNFLEKNKHKISAVCSAGDADFIVEYSTNETSHNLFKKEIYDLLKTAPRESKDEGLIKSYKISKTHISKGTNNNFTELPNYELTNDEIQKLTLLQKDYTNKKNYEPIKDEKDVKKFLHDLKERQIILSYYIIGEQIRPVTKAYILMLYTKPGFADFIFQEPQIKESIIDFNMIAVDDAGDDEFYKLANFLIIAEFPSISDYHEWKEKMYKISLENNLQINVMTFITEHIVSEIPVGIGNYALFDEICKSYNTGLNDKVVFGHPYYYSELKTEYNICINLKTLKEHGFIIGEPGQGKTYTAMILAKKLFDKKKRVHIVDASGGISDKFKEVFPNLIDSDVVKHVEITDKLLNDFSLVKSHNIHFYQPEKDKLNAFAKNIFDYIISMANPDESRTTNDIVIFEEAHLLFRNEETKSSIMEAITISGRKGISIWFSTQKLSFFPSTLLSNLRNRIIHKIDNNEKSAVAELLRRSGEETIYENLEKELVSLQKTQAIVSFVYEKNGVDMELSPIKIGILKE